MRIQAGVQFLFVKVPICKEGHIPLWQRTIQSREKVHQSLSQLNDIAPPWTRLSLLSLSSNAKSFFAVSYPTRNIRWISDTVILPSFSTISKIFFLLSTGNNIVCFCIVNLILSISKISATGAFAYHYIPFLTDCQENARKYLDIIVTLYCCPVYLKQMLVCQW